MGCVCPTCDKSFDTSGGMKKHHYYSHGESIAKETSRCNFCDNEFEYYPSNKKGLYCTYCVKSKQYRHTPEVNSGKEHPRYSSKEVECEFCGNTLLRRKSRIDLNKRNFCNTFCYGRWRSNFQQGDSNPNFVDGQKKSKLYTGTWSKNKKIVLERDGYSCQLCGKNKKQIGRNPDVHHIKPIREFDNLERGHKTENLICLCPECHNEVEHE